MITNPRKYIILQDVNNTEYRFDHLSNINPELDGIGKIVEYSNGWVTENGYTYEDGPLCKFRILRLRHWDLNRLEGVYAICESNPSIGMRPVYVGETENVVNRFNYNYGFYSRRMNEHAIYVNKNILKSLKSGNTLSVYFLPIPRGSFGFGSGGLGTGYLPRDDGTDPTEGSGSPSKRMKIEISIINKNSSPYLWNRTGNNSKSSSSTNNRKPPPTTRPERYTILKEVNMNEVEKINKPKKEWEPFEAKASKLKEANGSQIMSKSVKEAIKNLKKYKRQTERRCAGISTNTSY